MRSSESGHGSQLIHDQHLSTKMDTLEQKKEQTLRDVRRAPNTN